MRSLIDISELEVGEIEALIDKAEAIMASPADYAGATGLEALLGYLYLTGQSGRIRELLPYLQGEEESHAGKTSAS